ncbi:hypothetical protein [uncultured Algibacter sp.]|uniref:hypothetical protein n=1 Tax=uncultured Algibacter sp. TaxID=298659 RepID=UPI0030ECBCDB|tara:strand:- start:4374 stop:4712 length:339 start_codon:yes stop_codon:yes gene_type:complete
MEDKDQLKEILSNINNINEPIDLEASIMQSIRNEELTKHRITNYRRQGIRGLVVSFVLDITLVSIYSFSKNFQVLESTSFKYTSIAACLILLFAQLEIGGLQFINQIKNNKS